MLDRAHITTNKNGIPIDPAKAHRDLGHPPRFASRHLAQNWNEGIRGRRPYGCRGPGRAWRRVANRGMWPSRRKCAAACAALTRRFPIY